MKNETQQTTNSPDTSATDKREPTHGNERPQQSIQGDDANDGRINTELYYEESPLPSPEELAKMQSVAPELVSFMCDLVKMREQHHQRLEIMQAEDNRTKEHWEFRKMIVNDTLVISIILSLFILTGFALYYDREWFAGISFLSGIGTLISSIIYARTDSNREQ